MGWVLEDVTVSDLSSIQYRGRVSKSDDHDNRVLVLSFSGKLPEGSAGNADARFMSFVTGEFVSFVFPDCVVFDFRELGYTFGNYLFGLVEAVDTAREGLPIIYVASEKCRIGLRSHLASADGDTSDFLFEDFNAAMERAVILAVEFGESDK